MDWQTGFNIMVGIAGAGVTLYVRSVQDKLREQREDHLREISKVQHDIRNNQQSIASMREYIPQTYVTIPDLDKAVAQVNHRITDIFSVLTRMEDKLDRFREKSV